MQYTPSSGGVESKARPQKPDVISSDRMETACMIRRSIRHRAVNIDEPSLEDFLSLLLPTTSDCMLSRMACVLIVISSCRLTSKKSKLAFSALVPQHIRNLNRYPAAPNNQ